MEPNVLPERVERELRDRTKADRLDYILDQAVASAEKKMDSAFVFCTWAKRNLQSAPSRERSLAQAQYIAACREYEAARATFARVRAARDRKPLTLVSILEDAGCTEAAEKIRDGVPVADVADMAHDYEDDDAYEILAGWIAGEYTAEAG